MINNLLLELMNCFYRGFINREGQFVATNDGHAGDAWFSVLKCETKEDLMYKVVSRMSRSAYKTCPWSTKAKNEQYHEYIRHAMIKYLNTYLDADDCEILYQKFGNGLREEECREWIADGMDMRLLYEES